MTTPSSHSPGRRTRYRKSVFDTGRRGCLTEDVAAGLQVNAFSGFRRTDSDRKPPRRVLTAVLLGDPMPGRTIPTPPVEDDAETVTPADKPIFLTFREMHAYYGDPETE